MSAFLTYITEHAITDKLDKIKEQRIGCEVLGRKPDYDPAADNIVRVRAHELRQKLAKYFTTEGAQEPVVITIPRGSYVPAFEPRPVAAPASAEIVRTEPAAVPRWRLPWLPWALAGVLSVVVVVQFFSRSEPSRAGSAVAARSVAVRDLWGQFFKDKGQEATLVAADSGFALWQDMTGQDLNLGDYLGRKYLQSGIADPKLREVATRRCTSPADLSIALRVDEVSRSLGGRLKAQYARNLNLHDLRTMNAVIVGSRRSNPWVELFESHLNFILARDPRSGAPSFVNKSPRRGEPARFAILGSFDVEGTEQKEMESFALVALVPNLSENGRVLLLQGLNMEGTDAAGEIVTDPDRLAGLLSQIGHKSGTPVTPFEALLKLTSVPGGYANPRVIAFRRPA